MASSKLYWMPLYTADLVSSCVDMTPHQFGAYVRLLCYAWDNGGLPNDCDACSRIAGGIEASDWKTIRRRLEVVDGGTDSERLTHPRLEAEREKQRETHKKRSEAGKAGNQNRWRSPGDRRAIAGRSHLELELELDRELEEEEIQPAAPVVPTSDPPKASRSPAKHSVRWSADAGWSGITDADRQAWAVAYPAAIVDQELARAAEWLLANPTKAVRKNWRKFLSGWLSRCQDRGGSVREGATARGVAAPPVDQSKRRYYRSDAAKSLTDEQYAAWRSQNATAAVAEASA